MGNASSAVEQAEKFSRSLSYSQISFSLVNWQNKARNVESLCSDASMLNMGAEHLVFIDDNPMEIENMRTYENFSRGKGPICVSIPGGNLKKFDW
eukprot:638858-Amphidinium_carterae.1